MLFGYSQPLVLHRKSCLALVCGRPAYFNVGSVGAIAYGVTYQVNAYRAQFRADAAMKRKRACDDSDDDADDESD